VESEAVAAGQHSSILAAGRARKMSMATNAGCLAGFQPRIYRSFLMVRGHS